MFPTLGRDYTAMGRWVGCGMKEWEEYREQRMYYDDNERGMSS